MTWHNDPTQRRTYDSKPKADGDPWFHRGYLHHFDAGASRVQHVCVHLADSLPPRALDELAQQATEDPSTKARTARRLRMERWLDAGYGSCVLTDSRVAEGVEAALLHFHGVRYVLHEWVIMPSHLHVLFHTLAGHTLAKTVGSWKRFIARLIGDAARAGELEEVDLATLTPVWHREYWDRFIRDHEHYRTAIRYIRQNPVKAGLVDRPEDWRWSSAWKKEQGRE